LLFTLALSFSALPAFAATTAWVLLADPPKDVAIGATIRAGVIGATGTAKVSKKKNRGWHANGRITPNAENGDNGAFTGSIAGHSASNLPVRKVSALTAETGECANALDAVVAASVGVYPRPRNTIANLDLAATAIQRAREFAAGSTLPDETKTDLDDNYENSLTAIAAARKYAAGLSRRPTTIQAAHLLGIIGGAVSNMQDSFRILLAFEPE
jgi:hypothetical protein